MQRFPWECYFYFDTGKKHLIGWQSAFSPLSPSYIIRSRHHHWNEMLAQTSHAHTLETKMFVRRSHRKYLQKSISGPGVLSSAGRPAARVCALESSPWRQLRAREGTMRCRRRISTREVYATCIFLCVGRFAQHKAHAFRFVYIHSVRHRKTLLAERVGV